MLCCNEIPEIRAPIFRPPFSFPDIPSLEVSIHLLLVEDVGQVAAAAVLSVLHGSHEDTSTALFPVVSMYE